MTKYLKDVFLKDRVQVFSYVIVTVEDGEGIMGWWQTLYSPLVLPIGLTCQTV